MASQAEISKLRRENEVLRRELENLRGAKKNSVATATHIERQAATSDLNFVTDFKFLRNDLLRTATLTVLALTFILAVYALGPKVPQLNTLISSINI
jgi:hypothetical protein